MKKNKVFRTAIAVILALVSLAAVTTAAAEYATDDGMTFQIVTSKKEYGVNEEVQIILLAKNYNTNMKLANISWNATVPGGELTFLSGDLQGMQTHIRSAAAFYPMMVGMAEEEKAARLVKQLTALEQEYGVAATENFPGISELQWDYPHGWACLQYVMITGLLRYGYRAKAQRIAQKYCTLVERNYENTSNIWEKYDAVSGEVSVTKEYESPQMMGWCAGIYLYYMRLLQ